MMDKLFILLALSCVMAEPQESPKTGMLSAHNLYRKQVGTPPLVWSNRLATIAQSWANLLVARGVFRPQRDGKYGENLFEIVGSRTSERHVVAAWAAEGSNYNRQTNTCSSRCGHYTQVVWRDTARVGCGAARDSRREVWVCRYDPPGNIVGERPY